MANKSCALLTLQGIVFWWSGGAIRLGGRVVCRKWSEW